MSMYGRQARPVFNITVNGSITTDEDYLVDKFIPAIEDTTMNYKDHFTGRGMNLTGGVEAGGEEVI